MQDTFAGGQQGAESEDMSGYRHRHRLRHMANPHCWFRRPAEDAERYADDLEAQARNYATRDYTAMGIPLPQVARRGDNREQEEEEDYHMALVSMDQMHFIHPQAFAMKS